MRAAFALGLFQLARFGFGARLGGLGVRCNVGLLQVVLDVLLVVAARAVAALAFDLAFGRVLEIGGAGALLRRVAFALGLLLQAAALGLGLVLVRHTSFSSWMAAPFGDAACPA